MTKNKKTIEVKGLTISLSQKEGQDFISLTDIAAGFEGGNALIENWMRNKNTIEFLGVWEELYNPGFNSIEFEGIKSEAGSNRFVLSVKKWIEKTGAIGISAKTGRYGGTYARKDIAVEFCAWLDPRFKLYLIREFDRLKEQEALANDREWNLGRMLSKVNYRLHTEAIRENILPALSLAKNREGIVYADEAELLNLALFGITSKEWRSRNPEAMLDGKNLRDEASIAELIVLSNLESYNAIMIKQGLKKEERFAELQRIALENLRVLGSLSLRLDVSK